MMFASLIGLIVTEAALIWVQKLLIRCDSVLWPGQVFSSCTPVPNVELRNVCVFHSHWTADLIMCQQNQYSRTLSLREQNSVTYRPRRRGFWDTPGPSLSSREEGPVGFRNPMFSSLPYQRRWENTHKTLWLCFFLRTRITEPVSKVEDYCSFPDCCQHTLHHHTTLHNLPEQFIFIHL